jgi:hypothetical protein
VSIPPIDISSIGIGIVAGHKNARNTPLEITAWTNCPTKEMAKNPYCFCPSENSIMSDSVKPKSKLPMAVPMKTIVANLKPR